MSNSRFIKTKLKDCYVIEPKVFYDDRGFFEEAYNKKELEKGVGATVNFVQDNISKSDYGVLRGLHFQKGEYSQAKLVNVLKGEVLDVVIDLRKNSATFGDHFSVVLSQENKKKLFVPRGFAHGFAVLSETAIFAYKCDAYYNKESESGIIFNDHQLNIDWHIPDQELVLSKKDSKLPAFEDAYKFSS